MEVVFKFRNVTSAFAVDVSLFWLPTFTTVIAVTIMIILGVAKDCKLNDIATCSVPHCGTTIAMFSFHASPVLCKFHDPHNKIRRSVASLWSWSWIMNLMLVTLMFVFDVGSGFVDHWSRWFCAPGNPQRKTWNRRRKRFLSKGLQWNVTKKEAKHPKLWEKWMVEYYMHTTYIYIYIYIHTCIAKVKNRKTLICCMHRLFPLAWAVRTHFPRIRLLPQLLLTRCAGLRQGILPCAFHIFFDVGLDPAFAWTSSLVGCAPTGADLTVLDSWWWGRGDKFKLDGSRGPGQRPSRSTIRNPGGDRQTREAWNYLRWDYRENWGGEPWFTGREARPESRPVHGQNR